MVNVLFCGNDGVFDGFLTCMLSMMKRTSSDEPFAFHIFTMELTRLSPKYTGIPPERVALLDKTIFLAFGEGIRIYRRGILMGQRKVNVVSDDVVKESRKRSQKSEHRHQRERAKKTARA